MINFDEIEKVLQERLQGVDIPDNGYLFWLEKRRKNVKVKLYKVKNV